MKKFLFTGLLFVSVLMNAQDVGKDEIKKEVVRVLDSINSVNKEKQNCYLHLPTYTKLWEL